MSSMWSNGERGDRFWGVVESLVRRVEGGGEESFRECCRAICSLSQGGLDCARVEDLPAWRRFDTRGIFNATQDTLGVGGEGDCEGQGCGVRQATVSDDDDGSGGHTFLGHVDGSADGAARGKNYTKNKAKKEKKKKMSGNWRQKVNESGGGCVSDESMTGSVGTVDTRTAVEIEASQTLAARRVAENKRAVLEAQVKAKLAEHRLRALNDPDRTVMVDRLAAARGEERINTAKAKSQQRYKECDESMKSLGSSGSAGEFALKLEVKRARTNDKILAYVRQQAELFEKHATPEVRSMVAQLPPPVLPDPYEIFGPCPSDYDDDQRESYYADLERLRNEENDLTAVY